MTGESRYCGREVVRVGTGEIWATKISEHSDNVKQRNNKSDADVGIVSTLVSVFRKAAFLLKQHGEPVIDVYQRRPIQELALMNAGNLDHKRDPCRIACD